MELFDTYFIWFSQVLAVSGEKTLVISHRCVLASGKIRTVPRLFSEHLHQDEKNFRLWMYTLNGTVWYLFCLVWSSISCFRDENVSHKSLMCISGKTTTVPKLFSEHLLQDEKKTVLRVWMYTINGTVWYLFCLVWSSISCFRDENVSHKSPMCISGKITMVPKALFRTLTPR